LFADISKAPAVQSLARRLEHGGVLTCAGVSQAAQPFFAALLWKIFPRRPIVVVTDNLKTQESFQQDLETWLSSGREPRVEGRGQNSPGSRPSTFDLRPLFYPAWDVLPHEGKLPHADTISDRLQALVALNQNYSEGGATRRPNFQGLVELAAPKVPIVVTSVTALLQKTFAPDDLKNNTRTLARGDKINPLDLIEWLEERGCEPEAQVTQKGEIALRGGILDVWPLTSPWPVRLEFFGNELESLRHFDPLTQISREEILSITLPPAGELGVLKQHFQSEGRVARVLVSSSELGTRVTRPSETTASLATLLDYLPPETIFLLCEPEPLAARADEYAQQIPENDPFFIPWTEFIARLDRKAMTRLEVSEADAGVQA
jgi:transcription-repair coupling factor (superfamily II helicase)